MSDSESEITSHLLGHESDNSASKSNTERAADLSNNSNNPTGKNQHKHCPPIGDNKVHAALLEYHRRNITNKHIISKLLQAEHGIKLSASSVTRHKAYWNIQASGVTTRNMPDLDKRQLVLNEMAKDPGGKRGPRTIKEIISLEHSVHLTRDFISAIMREEDPDGFEARNPRAKKNYSCLA